MPTRIADEHTATVTVSFKPDLPERSGQRSFAMQLSAEDCRRLLAFLVALCKGVGATYGKPGDGRPETHRDDCECGDCAAVADQAAIDGLMGG